MQQTIDNHLFVSLGLPKLSITGLRLSDSPQRTLTRQPRKSLYDSAPITELKQKKFNASTETFHIRPISPKPPSIVHVSSVGSHFKRTQRGMFIKLNQLQGIQLDENQNLSPKKFSIQKQSSPIRSKEKAPYEPRAITKNIMLQTYLMKKPKSRSKEPKRDLSKSLSKNYIFNKNLLSNSIEKSNHDVQLDASMKRTAMIPIEQKSRISGNNQSLQASSQMIIALSPLVDCKIKKMDLQTQNTKVQFNPHRKYFNNNSLFQKAFVEKDQNIKPKIDFSKVRHQLINCLHYIKKLKLTPKILMSQQVFSSQPFQKAGSKNLIYAAKSNDLSTLELYLNKNRFLVYDFDFIQLTALHWACKRGHIESARILLDYGSDVDAEDMIGRTPLLFAVENKDPPMMKLLLCHGALPWSTENIKYDELVKNNPELQHLITRARKLQIIMKMTPPNIREQTWKFQINDIFR